MGVGKGLGTPGEQMPGVKPAKPQQSSGNSKPMPMPAGNPFAGYLKGKQPKR